MAGFIKKQPPARIIAVGFLAVILIGSLLLFLPVSLNDGVKLGYVDALYTSVSAVCVTGLNTIDPGSTFSVFGKIILALLIQIGGLGVASVGAGVIIAIGKRVDMKSRNVLKEALNLDSRGGVVRFLGNVFLTTAVIELAGAVAGFFVFRNEYPVPEAIGISLFHSVASFNNSGFDIFGKGTNMIPYKNNLPLNLITATLIILGGIGFPVIKEVLHKKFRVKKLSMHSRVVISVSTILTVVGMLLLRLTENISWLGAFFTSVSARTAGFSTCPLSDFTNAGRVVMLFLMFVGASPGSTAGGIKTTTLFVLLQGIKSSATNRSEKAFHYSVPENAFKKAAVITLIGIAVVTAGTFVMSAAEPSLALSDILLEVVSAFGTVGLSTGITPTLSLGSKLLSMVIMYIGRLGPLTIATMWYFSNGERSRYPEGNIAIG